MTRPGITGAFHVSSESQTVTFFMETAGKALGLLFSVLGHTILTNVSGDNNFTFKKLDSPSIFCAHKGGDKALLCGQGKKRNLSLDGLDLVSRFQKGDRVVVDNVYQSLAIKGSIKRNTDSSPTICIPGLRG